MKFLEKELIIFNKMIEDKIIPEKDNFIVTEKLIQTYVDLYPKIFGNNGYKPRPTDLKYFRKLATLSLYKLSNSRVKDIKVIKNLKSNIDDKSGFLYIVTNPIYTDYFKKCYFN